MYIYHAVPKSYVVSARLMTARALNLSGTYCTSLTSASRYGSVSASSEGSVRRRQRRDKRTHYGFLCMSLEPLLETPKVTVCTRQITKYNGEIRERTDI